MSSLFPLLTLLAVDPPAAAPDQASPFTSLMPMMAIVAVFFYLVVMRPAAKDRKRHDDMINNLDKNARVVTIGGIIGTVVSVSQDKKEVTLKVDDNTRIKVIRSAISSVVKDQPAPDADKKS